MSEWLVFFRNRALTKHLGALEKIMLNNVEGDAAHNFCPAKCLSVQGSCGFRVSAQRDTVPCSCVPWGKMQMGFVWGVENYRIGFANLSASGGDLGAPAGPCS